MQFNRQVYLRHLPTALATLVTLATLSPFATLITFATLATIHLLRLLQYICYTCCPMSLLHLLATLFAIAKLATLATLFEVVTLHWTGGINRQPYHKLSALSLFISIFYLSWRFNFLLCKKLINQDFDQPIRATLHYVRHYPCNQRFAFFNDYRGRVFGSWWYYNTVSVCM